MGPRQRCRGISAKERKIEGFHVASMGPRQRCRGIRYCKHAGGKHGSASMGPRQRCRGIEHFNAGRELRRLLQWGRGSAAAELAKEAREKAEADALQWGRGSAAAEFRARYSPW